ncbi:MAG: 30S ribosomal protein S17 [Microgenomates group bacterium GW2011_GWC1_39_12]|nr:MAG: 30S ribosomal protein S17 [Microgenomates group bacterium GW2011_GWC1_39_12]
MTTIRKGKTFIGKVAHVGVFKTITVEVVQITRHPLYRKTMRSTKRFLVHYEGTALKVGDAVTIIETRPISRMKRFTVLEQKGK